VLWGPSRHLGSSTAANWVSFDLNVSCSSCWGYSLINTLKLKKKTQVEECVQPTATHCNPLQHTATHCISWINHMSSSLAWIHSEENPDQNDPLQAKYTVWVSKHHWGQTFGGSRTMFFNLRSQSPISIPLASFHRKVSKEAQRTNSTFKIVNWRNYTPNATGRTIYRSRLFKKDKQRKQRHSLREAGSKKKRRSWLHHFSIIRKKKAIINQKKTNFLKG